MNTEHDLSRWTQRHDYHQASPHAERGTRYVLWITLLTMVIEIAAGIGFNSMAVLADGWHMSSHAVAIGLSVLAYTAARKYAGDPRFAFGTWKIEVLGGYTSAVLLLVVSVLMGLGAIERLLDPQAIRYGEALLVAVLGLLVNLGCAVILHRAGHPEHAHGGDHPPHAHRDLNLTAAYVHVVTDALTSILAIAALTGGWLWGWDWLDPACAIVGAILVALWARRLLGDTGRALLDREMDHPIVTEIRDILGALPGSTHITDLHVWRVGNGQYACALSLLTHTGELTALQVRQALAQHDEIVHLTVEIHRCDLCPA